MRFLGINEIWTWCPEHGFGLSPENEPELPASASFRERMHYADGQRSGREPEVASQCVEAMGRWTECLLWVTLWGVWPSGEDWPTYYAARKERGEHRPLDEAPGHLFRSGEEADLRNFLTLVLENAWDAWVLPATGEAYGEAVAMVSHDEIIDVYAIR